MDSPPLFVVLLQVGEEITHLYFCHRDFEVRDIVVLQPVSASFLRDVLLVGVKLSGEEFRAATLRSIKHRNSFVFNNNKHALFTN